MPRINVFPTERNNDSQTDNLLNKVTFYFCLIN
jgi:hypothetical protein